MTDTTYDHLMLHNSCEKYPVIWSRIDPQAEEILIVLFYCFMIGRSEFSLRKFGKAMVIKLTVSQTSGSFPGMREGAVFLLLSQNCL